MARLMTLGAARVAPHALALLGAVALGVPTLVARMLGVHFEPIGAAAVFGLGIVGGAFVITWAAEAAEKDVSASLALALLALIAILPEYSVEAVLAWKAGQSYDPATGAITEAMSLVSANVTGSNRLLIGLGWSLVILTYWLKRRKAMDLRGHAGLEQRMLVAATMVTLLIVAMGQVHVAVALGLVLLYLLYLGISSRQEAHEPELVGPAMMVGELPKRWRRAVVVVMFAFSAGVILAAAEPFVEGLMETGDRLGVSKFVLVQWVAPLASESPEIIAALLFTLRANPLAGITTLISAQVNQLTLLVGSMVAVFSLSAGRLLSFPLDAHQRSEFLLMGAASAFAILLMGPRIVSWRAGLALLSLFAAHLFFTSTTERYVFAAIYAAATVAVVIVRPAGARMVLQGDGIVVAPRRGDE